MLFYYFAFSLTKDALRRATLNATIFVDAALLRRCCFDYSDALRPDYFIRRHDDAFCFDADALVYAFDDDVLSPAVTLLPYFRRCLSPDYFSMPPLMLSMFDIILRLCRYYAFDDAAFHCCLFYSPMMSPTIFRCHCLSIDEILMPLMPRRRLIVDATILAIFFDMIIFCSFIRLPTYFSLPHARFIIFFFFF